MAPQTSKPTPIERKRKLNIFLQDYPQIRYRRNFNRYHTFRVRKNKRRTLTPLSNVVYMHNHDDTFNNIWPALQAAWWAATAHFSDAARMKLFDTFWKVRKEGVGGRTYKIPVQYVKRPTLQSLIETENKSDAELQAQKAAEKSEHDARLIKMMTFVVKHKWLTLENKGELISDMYVAVTQWKRLGRKLKRYVKSRKAKKAKKKEKAKADALKLKAHLAICAKLEQVAQAQRMVQWRAEEAQRPAYWMEVELCRVFRRLRIEDEG